MAANARPKRSFALVDGSGVWLACVAMGQHAENAQLEDGRELLLYFCTAQGPIGSLTGAIDLMNDAVVVGLQHQVIVSNRRASLPIADQRSQTDPSGAMRAQQQC